MRYRIWIQNLKPLKDAVHTKYKGNEQAMEGRARSLRAYLARKNGDGQQRVFVVPDTYNPPINRQPLTGDDQMEQQYMVYDEHAYWKGVFTWDEAQVLCTKNDEWTMVEAIYKAGGN